MTEAFSVAHEETLPASTKINNLQEAVERQMTEYTIQRGDTLSQIAKSNNVPMATLVNINQISNPNLIFAGQVLRIPNMTARNSAPATMSNSPAATVTETVTTTTNVQDLFANPDISGTANIRLENNAPKLKDFILPSAHPFAVFTLVNGRSQESRVGANGGDWYQLDSRGKPTNKRALIFRGDNHISQLSLAPPAHIPHPETLEEQFTYIDCTTEQAVQFEKAGKVVDANGNRIIYRITDTQPFSLAVSSDTRYQKHSIAFHGSGFSEQEHGKANDAQVTASAIRTGARTMDFAFLVGQSGAIFQFFHPVLGFGALGSNKILESVGLNSAFNRQTIPVEIALRGDWNTYEHGVEPPNEKQTSAANSLRKALQYQFNIENTGVFTSKDAVSNAHGAHADDFSDASRKAMGIPLRSTVTLAMSQVRQKQSV